MRSGFSSYGTRLVASITALVGLSAVSACAPRAVSDADRTSKPISTPQPVVVQEPQGGVVTTQAIGEEDGARSATIDPEILRGIGEIEEVEGDFERIFIPPAPGEAPATTLAIGEEG